MNLENLNLNNNHNRTTVENNLRPPAFPDAVIYVMKILIDLRNHGTYLIVELWNSRNPRQFILTPVIGSHNFYHWLSDFLEHSSINTRFEEHKQNIPKLFVQLGRYRRKLLRNLQTSLRSTTDQLLQLIEHLINLLEYIR